MGIVEYYIGHVKADENRPGKRLMATKDYSSQQQKKREKKRAKHMSAYSFMNEIHQHFVYVCGICVDVIDVLP
uniref:Uncharacterized protein n=1 Tax=Glossina pallidipes TaxID=7398 RepID=A0A1B0AIU4_GLOPL